MLPFKSGRPEVIMLDSPSFLLGVIATYCGYTTSIRNVVLKLLTQNQPNIFQIFIKETNLFKFSIFVFNTNEKYPQKQTQKDTKYSQVDWKMCFELYISDSYPN